MHYDLIIVGGGLVGRTIACALQAASLNIALIDASAAERPDPRLIALNYGSFCFLNKLGLWSELAGSSAPIQEVQVSHRGHFGATRLSAGQIQLPALGYVVPAARINHALAKRLEQKTAGQFTELRPAKVTALALTEESANLSLEIASKQHSHISADLILAADGTDSTIRKLLNFDTKTIDYGQSAIVTTTRLSRPHSNIAYERFLPQGEALAMLPLKTEQDGDLNCATIWTASTQTINTLRHLSDADFLQKLQENFGYRLGRLQSITQRHIFPLHFIQVSHPMKNQVILVGNAAHTIHPIAAQGLNLALYEIAQLTQALLSRVEKQEPLLRGLAEELTSFQPKANLLFSHYLSQLFSADFWGMKTARSLGMVSFDLCPPLKRRFSRQLAMENLKWL